jgi:fumarate hydratase, class II
MSTALAPRIGYDIASAIAKTAYHENRTVREIASELVGLDPKGVTIRLGQPDSAAELRERGGFPSIEEVERLLDPYNQTLRGTGLQGGTSG